jgi:hypothetical protein
MVGFGIRASVRGFRRADAVKDVTAQRMTFSTLRGKANPAYLDQPHPPGARQQSCRFYSCHVPPVRATLDGDHL